MSSSSNTVTGFLGDVYTINEEYYATKCFDTEKYLKMHFTEKEIAALSGELYTHSGECYFRFSVKDTLHYLLFTKDSVCLFVWDSGMHCYAYSKCPEREPLYGWLVSMVAKYVRNPQEMYRLI